MDIFFKATPTTTVTSPTPLLPWDDFLNKTYFQFLTTAVELCCLGHVIYFLGAPFPPWEDGLGAYPAFRALPPRRAFVPFGKCKERP